MSIYYESAMRKSQRLEDERKATLAKGERMGAAVMSMVALGGESAKTKAAKAELDEFAKNEGFLFDKDTSMYYKPGVYEDGTPYIASMPMQTMSAFSMSMDIGIDDMIFGKDGRLKSSFTKLNTPYGVSHLYKEKNQENLRWLESWGNYYTPDKGWMTDALPNSIRKLIESEGDFGSPRTNWLSLDMRNKPINTSNYIQIAERFAQGNTGVLGFKGDTNDADEYFQEDKFVTLVNNEPALVNAAELYALESGLFSRDKVEEDMIANAKRALGADYNNRDNPIAFDIKTGLRKYQAGLGGAITSGVKAIEGLSKLGGGIKGVGKWAKKLAGKGWMKALGGVGAGLMGVQMIKGAFDTAKKYKQEATMLGGGTSISGGVGGKMGLHMAESADIAGEKAQKDIEKLQEDYNMKIKNMSGEFGVSTADMVGSLDAAQRQTRGLSTGLTKSLKTNALKRLRDSFSKEQENLTFQFDNAYEKYTKDLGSTLSKRQTQLDEMYEKWRYAKEHSNPWKNLI